MKFPKIVLIKTGKPTCRQDMVNVAPGLERLINPDILGTATF
jgi:hypothetical protein